ncbi:Short-chain dehydrogenase/reductase SDR [[Actinomadura] parvosata subsp. kistnae]|uniref:Short-chain dehydrogenase/reductase n=1 Tax=[Actinomadura] parvosata subsp. kistnae TaxID=1909395 RepID=A0A1V0AK79_9ACTN|nr:oxidoreductase [Nonomuraea sp. ATCC 55076]AQZ70618.1 short-chain dehydrogenase/reductase [Nonomuraea sp. ATCC 55076]SPL87423.1 Short-chain dehydrogenase/reductase SDR [Actinomadura parvosata subsp. kistnae]
MTGGGRVCLVTGASSGIGRATALALLRAGHTVYGAARRAERMEPLVKAGGHAIGADVTREEDLQRVVRTVVDAQGRVDVLVNNAGSAVYGSAEEVPIARARQVFDVNLFGPARLTQLVLPGMRERGSGTIVNISSIGGEIALPLGAWYHASKHALEGYSDSLRQEVARFGVRVVVVQPGIIRTDFQDGTPRELREISGHGPYRAVAEPMARRAEQANGPDFAASDPSVVAACVVRIVAAPAPRPRYAVGRLAKVMLGVNRLLPDRLYDKMVTRGA